MTSARAEARPRAGAGGAWWPALGIAAIWIFLGVLLVHPLARIFYDAFSDDAGRLTVRHFVDFATDGFYRRSLWNSLVLGLGTVAATSVLGFAIAMLLVRYDFVGRSLFSNLTLIPIVAPPLVGVLGFTFILGRAGTVNVLLMDWFDLLTPINFVYGVHGPPPGALPDRGPPLRGHQGLLVALVLARGEAAALAGTAGPGHPLPLAGDAGVVHPVCRCAPRVRGTRLVDDAGPAPLHAAVLRARHRRDAQVRREQLPVLDRGGGHLYRRRCSDRVAARADARARPRRPRWAQHADPGRSRDGHRHRLHPRLPRASARVRPRIDELLDHPAARPGHPSAAVHRPGLVRLAAPRPSFDGGGRGQRRRRTPAVVPRRDAAADVARHAPPLARLVHDVAPGSLGGAVPLPRRLGDDHRGHLFFLHRGQRQRSGRARRHPPRRRRGDGARDQPRRRHAHGWDVRINIEPFLVATSRLC